MCKLDKPSEIALKLPGPLSKSKRYKRGGDKELNAH